MFYLYKSNLTLLVLIYLRRTEAEPKRNRNGTERTFPILKNNIQNNKQNGISVFFTFYYYPSFNKSFFFVSQTINSTIKRLLKI